MTDPIRAAILAELPDGRWMHRDDLTAEAANRCGHERAVVWGTLCQLIAVGEVVMDGRGMCRKGRS